MLYHVITLCSIVLIGFFMELDFHRIFLLILRVNDTKNAISDVRHRRRKSSKHHETGDRPQSLIVDDHHYDEAVPPRCSTPIDGISYPVRGGREMSLSDETSSHIGEQILGVAIFI